MTITRCGYEKVIEQLKPKLNEREEDRTKLKKYHEGNDLLYMNPYLYNIGSKIKISPLKVARPDI